MWCDISISRQELKYKGDALSRGLLANLVQSIRVDGARGEEALKQGRKYAWRLSTKVVLKPF
jgi:hypothetical protein